jgi:hypothetical protein
MMKELTFLLIAGLCFSVSVGAQTPQEKAEIERARAFVKSKGLTLGGRGYGFVGNYGTKGLYAYLNGVYKGTAFSWTGGSEVQQFKRPSLPKFRIPGWKPLKATATATKPIATIPRAPRSAA